MDEPSFRRYHMRMLSQALADVRKDIRKGMLSYMVPILVAIAIALLQTKAGLIRTDQTWKSALINASPYIAIVLFYGLYHLARAPWKLDQERHREISSLQSELAQQREEYKAEIGELRRELSREINHRLSWRKAGQVDTLVNEARCLHSDLDHMLTVAGIPGNMHAALEHPLAEVTLEEYGCQGLPIEVWRFQKQFSSHRNRCVNLGVFGEDISAIFSRQWDQASPKVKADAVLKILLQHHESLLKYSDKVTDY